ncbi:MAG: CbiX/SirB N-terminal domain-containing protein [Myxococcota bacterium]
MKAILLVDHGSRREEANRALERVAEAVRDARPGVIVEAAHMEIAQPDVLAGVARCVEAGASEVVVFPYFLGPGRHTQRDMPELADAARRAHPNVAIRLAEPFGFDPRLVSLLLDRVDATDE